MRCRCIMLVVALLVLTAHAAQAATSRYWVGGTGNWNDTSHWSDASGGSSGSSVPDSSADAIFDGNSGGGTCTVNAAVAVLSLQLQSGNTTTISQGSYTVDVGSGGLQHAAGAFTGGTGGMTVAGSLALSGGTFTAPSGTLTVSSDFNHTGGTFAHNSGTVTFDGAGAQTVTTGGTGAGNAFHDVIVANTHATPDDANDVDTSGAIKVEGTLTVNDGQFQPETSSDLDIVTIGGNGIFKPDASATIYVAGDWTNNGVFTHGDGAVVLDGTTSIAGTSNTVFYDLTIDGTASVSLSDLVVKRDFTLTSGSFTAPSGTLTVSGDFTQNGGTYTHNSGVLKMDAGVAQTLNVTSAVNDLMIGDVPQTDLLAHWAFDEGSGTTALDSSGNGYDGTLQGDTTYVAGKIGSHALSFDGTDDYVLDDDGETYINGISAVTVSLWVKSDLTGTDRGFMIAQDPDDTDTVFGIRYDAAGWAYGGTDLIKAGITTTGGDQQIEGESGMQTTSWQHVAMTWSSGNEIEIFVDGVRNVPNGADAGQSGTVTGATKVIIGKGAKDSGTNSWDGLIDDVRFYSRVLSDTEIAALAAGGGSGGGGSATVTLGAALDVNGDLTINQATLDTSATAYAINVAGDWNNGGSFTHNSGTVTFDGTSSVKGENSTTFGDVTVSGSATIDTDTTADGTLAVSGTATVSAGCDLGIGTAISAEAASSFAAEAGASISNNGSGEYTITLSGDVNMPGTSGSPVTISNGSLTLAGASGKTAVASYVRMSGGYPASADSYLAITGAAWNGYRFLGWGFGGDQAPTSNLLAHWRFEETSGTTAADSSGNGYDGSLSGGASWSSAAKIGEGAVQLDGTDGVVDLGTRAAFDLTEFTIAGWFRTSDMSDYHCLTSKNVTSWTNRNWWVAVWEQGASGHGDGWLVFRTSSGGAMDVDIGSGVDVTDNAWHHFAVVLKPGAGNKAYLYLDGTERSTQDSPGTPDLPSTAAYLGHDPTDAGGRYFPGDLDDVRIYDRALDATEIAALHNYGVSRFTAKITTGDDVLMKEYQDTSGYTYGEDTDIDDPDASANGRVLWLATAVSLTDFTGRPGADGVALEWSTANELGNAGFRIYRWQVPAGSGLARLPFSASRPGPAWQLLTPARIPGADGSVTRQTYAYVDRTAKPGARYAYALVDEDLGGNASCEQPPVVVDVPDRLSRAGTDRAARPHGPALGPCVERVARILPGPFASRLLLTRGLTDEVSRSVAWALRAPAGEPQAVACAWRGEDARADPPVMTVARWKNGARRRGPRVRHDAAHARGSSTRNAPALVRRLRTLGRALKRTAFVRSVGDLAAAHLPRRAAEAVARTLGQADRSVPLDAAGAARPRQAPLTFPLQPAGNPRAVQALMRLLAEAGLSGVLSINDSWSVFEAHFVTGNPRAVQGAPVRGRSSNPAPRTQRRPPTETRMTRAQDSPPRLQPAKRRGGIAIPARDPEYDPGSRVRPWPFRPRERFVGPRARIEIRAEGLVRLAESELEALGFDLRQRFVLEHMGVRVPVWTVPAADGTGLDLCFFARQRHTLYSKTNVYHLRQTTRQRPRPVRTRPCREAGNGPSDYEATSRFEEDVYWRSFLPRSSGEEDHWFTRQLLFKGKTTSFALACDGPLAGRAGRVRLMLRNYTGAAHLTVAVNGVEVGAFAWDGGRRFLAEAEIPAGVLEDGDNTVTLASVGDTPQPLDIVYTDWVELRYRRPLEAIDGALVFTADTSGTARVGGLRTDRVLVADVTEEAGERHVRRLQVETAVDGRLAAVFPVSAGHRYAVSEFDALGSPGALEAVGTPPDLSGLDAELLVVSTDALHDAALAYARMHRSEGMTVEVFTLSDALAAGYHGLYDPEAILRLIRKLRPRYVLMLGDMTFDYFGVYSDDVDYAIPAPFVVSQDLHAVSDYAYAIAFGAESPVAVGRIPVRTPEQARVVLDKIEGRAAGGAAAWDLVTAACDSQGHFRESCERAAAVVDGAVKRAYIKDLGLTEARSALLSGWNQGARVVYFSGHGSQHQWAKKKLFETPQVAGLTEQAAPPLVIQLDCLSSGVHLPAGGGYACLAEALLLTPGRGASAVVGSVAVTPPKGQTELGVAMLQALQVDGATLGDAFAAAQAALAKAGTDPGVLRSFLLLGDPAAR